MSKFTPEKRRELARQGLAMPDGGYPIRNRSDLVNAIQAYGRGTNKPEIKRWIKKRAKELHAEKYLPDNWEVDDSDELAHYGIKGMKWGVRKDRKKSSGNRKKSSKRKTRKNNANPKKPKMDLQTAIINYGSFVVAGYIKLRIADFLTRGAISRGISNVGNFLNARLQDFYDSHPTYEIPVRDYRVD